MGLSSCSSAASRSRSSSSTSSSISSVRASGRSILLTTMMTLWPRASALLQDKAGLGHGALRRVHQQQDAVDHLEDPLHLAAEVGVSRGVDQC